MNTAVSVTSLYNSRSICGCNWRESKAVTKYGVPAVSAVVAIDDVATARHKAATAAGYPADVAWWVEPVLDVPHYVVDQAVAAVQKTAPKMFRQ